MSSTISTAAREYANRPADERFSDLSTFVEAARHEKNLTVERSYNLRDLHVVADADAITLQSPKGSARMSHWAFGQLCRSLGAPAGYLRELPADLAATCLNYGISDAPTGMVANLLVKAPHGTPYPMVRACTSDSYGRVWDADLYGAVVQTFGHDPAWGLPPTWDGPAAGAYRGDRDSFLLLTNGGSIVTDPSLRGRDDASMFRGIMIRNSETGACSVTIEQVLYRFICGNHLLWGAVIDRTFRRRHVGTRVLRDTVREIHTIARKWTQQGTAQDDAIIRSLSDRELAHTREAVIDELRAVGATKEQAERAYDEAERREVVSPRSYWGLAQGITRISQDTEYQDERYALDRLAIDVLRRGRKLVAA